MIKINEYFFLIEDYIHLELEVGEVVPDTLTPDFIINGYNLNYFKFLFDNWKEVKIFKPITDIDRYYPKNNLVSTNLTTMPIYPCYIQKGVKDYYMVWDIPEPFNINYSSLEVENYKYQGYNYIPNNSTLIFVIENAMTKYISDKYNLELDVNQDFILTVDYLGNINYKEIPEVYMGVPYIDSFNISRFDFILENLRYLKDIELVDYVYRFTLKMDQLYI